MWVVTITNQARKSLQKLPKRILIIYRTLVSDMEREGPMPFGWDACPLKEKDEIRIRLNREYRVLVVALKPNIIVVRVAHRREAYK